jgi:hypothetical protein
MWNAVSLSISFPSSHRIDSRQRTRAQSIPHISPGVMSLNRLRQSHLDHSLLCLEGNRSFSSGVLPSHMDSCFRFRRARASERIVPQISSGSVFLSTHHLICSDRGLHLQRGVCRSATSGPLLAGRCTSKTEVECVRGQSTHAQGSLHMSWSEPRHGKLSVDKPAERDGKVSMCTPNLLLVPMTTWSER